MLKRLGTMTSMKRMSLQGKEGGEEAFDDAFEPFNIKDHDIQEISVVACDRKNRLLLFTTETKQGQKVWRSVIPEKTLELFALSMSHRLSIGGSNKLFPVLETSEEGVEISTEVAKEVVELWLNSILSVTYTPGEVNQLYCVLLEKYAIVHLTDEYMTRIDSPLRCSSQRIIKTGYVTKLGGNKNGGQGNWKRRYLVLGSGLKYFKSEEDFLKMGEAKGIVSLSAYFVAEGEAPNALFEFTVYTIPFPFTCRADSSAEMRAWIDTLRFAQALL